MPKGRRTQSEKQDRHSSCLFVCVSHPFLRCHASALLYVVALFVLHPAWLCLMLCQSACGWGSQPSPAILFLLFPLLSASGSSCRNSVERLQGFAWWFFRGPKWQVFEFAFRMRTSKCSTFHFFLGVHQVLVLFYVKRSILKFTALFSLLGLITYKRLLLISRSVFGGVKCHVLFLDYEDAASARNNLSHIIVKLTKSLMIKRRKRCNTDCA